MKTLFCHSFARMFNSIDVLTGKKNNVVYVTLYDWHGAKFPNFWLARTNQVLLEKLLLKLNTEPGFFCSGPERRAGSGDENIF